MGRFLRFAACFAALAGCSSDPDTPGLAIANAQFVEGAWADEDRVALAEELGALGATSAGTLAFAADSRVFELVAGMVEPRTLFVSTGETADLGSPVTIAARARGGAWIGTNTGVFALDGTYVTKSPLMLDGVTAIRERAAGALTGLWIVAANGLLRATDSGFERFQFEGLEAATGVAVIGDAMFVVHDGHLSLVTPSGSGYEAERLDQRHALGTIADVAATSSALYAATSRGLLEWKSGSGLLLYEVGPLIALASHDSVVWARADGTIYRVATDLTRFVLPGNATRLVSPNAEELWFASGASLEKRSIASETRPVSFATDMVPWIETHCAECHGNQTLDFRRYDDFSEFAATALALVRVGDMPRCDGGLVCAEAQLEPSEYEVLERWIREGKKE